jgi:hypothetical protein
MVTFNSLACRTRRGMLESLEVLLLASAGAERAGFGWLIDLKKRAKDMELLERQIPGHGTLCK